MIARILIAAFLLVIFGKSDSATAKPALVFDMSSSLVLYAEDQDTLWHPASLTKMMTAYLVFDAIRKGKFGFDDKVVTTAAAHKQAPSKIGLPIGGKMSLETAIRALIVKSANDVAVMLAEKVAGTHAKFARQMNVVAKRLGMNSSRFVNANGLPDARQVTTARDMAILARALLRDFPEYKHYFALKDFRFGKRRLRSHNGLLRTFKGADGMKTGFICASGFNVVASATREGRQLIAVVLGSPSSGSRTLRTKSLLEHGFENYFWKTLFSTTNIDNLPYDVQTQGPKDIRRTVRARACGFRSPKRKRKPKKAKKKKVKKKTPTNSLF